MLDFEMVTLATSIVVKNRTITNAFDQIKSLQ